MSQFLSSIIAPNQDGSVMVHVPLQVLDPGEARVIAEQLTKCADVAEKAKDGKGEPSKIQDLFRRK